jgi:hypothetical protein
VSNAFYAHGRTHFARGDLHWRASGGDTFRVVLIDTALYTVDIDAHEYLSSIPAAARLSTLTLTTLEPTNGVLDAADCTFVGLTGDSGEALAIYHWSGSDATSELVLYIDSCTGLPVTPTGANVTVNWDNTATRIAKL